MSPLGAIHATPLQVNFYIFFKILGLCLEHGDV